MRTFDSIDELAIYDSLFEPVAAVKEKGELIYFNHSFRIFSRLAPRLLRNAKISDLVKSPKLMVQDFIGESVKKGDEVLSGEIDLVIDGQKKFAVLKSAPFMLGKEKAVFLFFNDLSVERELYDKYRINMEELKGAYKQILSSDKLSTMGELTASISHEITNPLTVAKGNLEVLEYCLRDKTTDPEMKKQSLQTSVKNLWASMKRIHAIIYNMKNYLHSAEDKKEYIRLDDVISSSIDLVSNFIKEGGIRIEKEITDQGLVALANKVKIEQVLVNLLKNSIDSIAASGASEGVVKVKLSKDSESEKIVLDVSDDGPGISQENQESIFNMFFTTKKVGDGTGLGLSICTRIMDSHNGKVKLVSSKKGETVFRLEIPVIEASSYCNSESNLNRLVNKEGVKILVVDNEVEVLNVFNTIFMDSEYLFIGSTDPREAIKFIDSMNVDLIITDYEMPGMNGSEFVAKLRDKGVTIPVFYLSSGSNLEKYNYDKDSLNISGFIVKPFGRDQILDAIENVLGEKPDAK